MQETGQVRRLSDTDNDTMMPDYMYITCYCIIDHLVDQEHTTDWKHVGVSSTVCFSNCTMKRASRRDEEKLVERAQSAAPRPQASDSKLSWGSKLEGCSMTSGSLLQLRQPAASLASIVTMIVQSWKGRRPATPPLKTLHSIDVCRRS